MPGRSWLAWAATGIVGAAILAVAGTHYQAAAPAPTPKAQAARSPESLPAPSPIPTPPQASPSPLPSPSPFVYLQIISVEYGVFYIQTDAGSVCNLTVTMDDGSHPRGLQNPQVASWDGYATWVYTQDPYNGDGTGVVTCTRDGMSATGSASFTVDHS